MGPLNLSTRARGSRSWVTSRMISTRSSGVNNAASLCGLYATAMMTSSKSTTLRRMISMWPLWMGSKVPGKTAMDRLCALFLPGISDINPTRRRRLRSPVKGDTMIANSHNIYANQTLRRFRRGRCALVLLDHNPSSFCDQAALGDSTEHFGTHVILERGINEYQVKFDLIGSEFIEGMKHSSAQNPRTIAHSKRMKVVVDRADRGAGRIDESSLGGPSRKRLASERTAAGEHVEHPRAFELEAHLKARENRLPRPRRSWARPQSARRLKTASVRPPCNHPHRTNLPSVKYIRSGLRPIDSPFHPDPQGGAYAASETKNGDSAVPSTLEMSRDCEFRQFPPSNAVLLWKRCGISARQHKIRERCGPWSGKNL